MKVCVVDIEGNSLNEIVIDSKSGKISREADRIHCVAVGDMKTDKITLFDPDDVPKVARYLKKYDKVIGHNIISYDFPVMRRILNVSRPRILWDTLIVSRMMYPDSRANPMGGNSLECWGNFLKIKKQQYNGGFDEYSDIMGRYCVQDVRVGMAIYRYQKKFVAQHKRFVKFEHRVAEILMEQTDRGFGYDLDGGHNLYAELMQEKEDIYDSFQKMFPPITIKRVSEKTGKTLKPKIIIFNPNSRPMIYERLHKKYGWEPPRSEPTVNFPTGQPKVDETTLAAAGYKEAKRLLKYMELTKRVKSVEDWNTRAELSRDGRIHGHINSLGAVTTRCTHSQPNVSQVDKNESCRRLWIPGVDDWMQLGCDLKGLEARMLGHFLSEWDGGAYAEVCLKGDVHMHHASIAGIDEGDPAKTKEKSKRFIYAFFYGAAELKLSTVLECSEKQASKIKNRFINELPGFSELITRCKNYYKSKGRIKLVDGRWVPIRSGHSALNTLLQGSGSVVSKQWMILTDQELSDELKQLSYSHDELQFMYEGDKKRGHRLGKHVCKLATAAGKKFRLNIRIDADYKIGESWAETH